MFGVPCIRCAFYNFYGAKIYKAFLRINECVDDIEVQGLREVVSEIREYKVLGQDALDDALNELFLLETYFEMVVSYISTWCLIKKGDFKYSWSSLQDAIDQICLLKQFLLDFQENKYLVLLEKQLAGLEKLYPYKVFFSVGLTANYECSVCGKDIDSLECEHMPGELYRGEVVCGVAKDIGGINHIAIVQNPANKRCVIDYDNLDAVFDPVRYLSNLINKKRLVPLNFDGVAVWKRIVKNPDFIRLKRNDLCFCGSGRKFKFCCQDKKMLEAEHKEILLNDLSVDDFFLLEDFSEK